MLGIGGVVNGVLDTLIGGYIHFLHWWVACEARLCETLAMSLWNESPSKQPVVRP